MYDPEEPRHEAIIRWRVECLERMGFGTGDATVLSLWPHVDLHEVRRLLDAGATHDQARDIVL